MGRQAGDRGGPSVGQGGREARGSSGGQIGVGRAVGTRDERWAGKQVLEVVQDSVCSGMCRGSSAVVR